MGITYTKRDDMKYTDLCIYIDSHLKDFESDDVDEIVKNTIYEYLYLILIALARKQNYFRDQSDYEEFASSTAAILYTRFSDKRQYLPDDDPKKIKKIKSCLNYINTAMYGLKVNYQQANYFKGVHPKEAALNSFETTSRNIVQADYNEGLEQAIITELSYLPNKIRRVINKTPYRDDPLICKNLYITLLLSFINCLTIPNSKQNKLYKNTDSKKDNKVLETFRKQLKEPPMLYHLDESMSDYITVLLRELKREFAGILVNTTRSFDLPDDVLESIMCSVYDTSDRRGDDDEY